MQHLTRKLSISTACAVCCACLSAAAALSNPLPAFAHDTDNQSLTINPLETSTGTLFSAPEAAAYEHTPASSGATTRMIQGGGSAEEDSNATIDRVDQPWGQIIRIIPGRGLSAHLFLPALPLAPVWDNDGTKQPDLQVLYLDRAYVDAPTVWERYGAYEWNEDWIEYATPDGNSIIPIYDDSWEEVLYCAVTYSSTTIDYRDFYLRATAITLKNGTVVETVFDSALIAYPEGSRPETEETPPPSITNPPDVSAGDSGGNRGNVVPGTSERVDPESSLFDLFPLAGRAQDAEASTTTTAPQTQSTADSSSATPAPDALAPNPSDELNASGGIIATSTLEQNAAVSTTENNSARHIPGFALALCATVAVVVAAGSIFAVRFRKMTRRADHGI